MRVVLVTGRAPHHKHLCMALLPACDLVGIIHPAEFRPPVATSLRRLLRYGRSSGWSLALMHVMGKWGAQGERRRSFASEAHAREADFSEAVAAYDRIPPTLIHSPCDVSLPASRDLLSSLRPDVVLFLGGPVYPGKFIEAAPLAFNFHSGISPLYNGAASIRFAFANGHPHLCGGTLMVMSARVDGGRILGHYLPEVRSADSPGSLFAKTVRGAALMYAGLLEHLQAKRGPWQSIPQSAPLYYMRSLDFGWYHNRMIARNLREDLPARFARNETIIEYWRQPTPEAALGAYRTTLAGLLSGSAIP